MFRLQHKSGGWVFSPLYSFSGLADGGQPLAGVAFGPNGSLYGTTYNGANGTGTVFDLRPSPSICSAVLCTWFQTVLYRFGVYGGNDGAYPTGDLVFDSAGNLYGATSEGGSSPYLAGTVYKLMPSGAGWIEQVIYNFDPTNGEGVGPASGVIFDRTGNLYGTTAQGGAYGCGDVYELTPTDSTLTLQEFVDQFFVPLAFPTLKPSTRERYRSTLSLHLLPALGHFRLCDVRVVEVQRFVLQKFDNGLGWETCSHLRNLLSKIFACGQKWGLIAGANPASAVELPEKRPASEKRVLMPEQIAQLLEVLREPTRTMVLLAVLTGLRVGEILALRWQDVDLATAQLRVLQAVYRGCLGSPKTKGSRRTVPLPEAAVRALKVVTGRTSEQNGDSLVFPSRKGTPLNDTNLLLRHLKPAARAIGAPWVSWHTFRRTHATLLQLAGGSAKDAQAQLGHSQITTTLGIYTIPLPAHQREAVEKLSQMVTNSDGLKENEQPVIVRSQTIQ